VAAFDQMLPAKKKNEAAEMLRSQLVVLSNVLNIMTYFRDLIWQYIQKHFDKAPSLIFNEFPVC
jgi:hypothetical protein